MALKVNFRKQCDSPSFSFTLCPPVGVLSRSRCIHKTVFANASLIPKKSSYSRPSILRGVAQCLFLTWTTTANRAEGSKGAVGVLNYMGIRRSQWIRPWHSCKAACWRMRLRRRSRMLSCLLSSQRFQMVAALPVERVPKCPLRPNIFPKSR